MSKLSVGQTLPEFTYDTPFASGLSMAETAKKARKTALIFLRYYGCTLCQYDIHQFALKHAEITAAGGQMLVVLQSDPAKLAAQIAPDSLPFDILCDPDQKLYKDFEIPPAPSMEAMIDPSAVAKIAKAKLAGYKHGDYEGEELQLPAAFVVDEHMVLTYAHYGKTAGDIPTPEELKELLA